MDEMKHYIFKIFKVWKIKIIFKKKNSFLIYEFHVPSSTNIFSVYYYLKLYKFATHVMVY